MNKGEREILRMFRGKLVGTKRMKVYVCKTLSVMPEHIIAKICSNCWFLSSMDDAFAFTFTGNDLQNQHLVFLSDELLHEDVNQITYTIAHEIGHVVLGHRNSIITHQSKKEIATQEQEADSFAKQYGF